MVRSERCNEQGQLDNGGPELLQAPEKEGRLTKEGSETLIVKEFVVNVFEDEPPKQEQPKKAALQRVFVLSGIDLI